MTETNPCHRTRLTRPEFPSYARMFAAMHDAMRRDAPRLVVAVDAQRPRLGARVPALARWFERFEAVIEHHHHCEDEIVWPGLEAIIAAEIVATREPRSSTPARVCSRTIRSSTRRWPRSGCRSTSRRPSSSDSDAARHFEACLDAHLAREEAAVFPLLSAHVSEEEFAVLEQAVVETTPFKALTFTVPWVMDGAPADVRRDGRRRPAAAHPHRQPTGDAAPLSPVGRRRDGGAGVMSIDAVPLDTSIAPTGTPCSPSTRSSSTPRASSPPSTRR